MKNVHQLNPMNEDIELQRLQQMHAEMGGTRPRVPKEFTLSDNQIEWIQEWQKQQIKIDDPYMGTVSFRFVYEFTRTSIGGDIVTVKDLVTGNEKDFTDYDAW